MTISSVLIANRGEIAVRIADACRKLGLRSIAVYSDADRDALHVACADDALRLGPGEARRSYLNVEAVLEAARRGGADAVHPGYGFLAESAPFATACADAGLVFIGPAAEAIEQMGSKIRAKAAAQAAGVPTVPGHLPGDLPGDLAEEQTDAALTAAAHAIGFPLMVKASAGGGGRGMRLVGDAAGLADALTLARGEALAAFGDPTLMLERYVARGRHVEVQILADRHGNVIHLLDRDCSVQRHHQKIIEEAPAHGLGEGARAAMLEQSVSLARAIGYDSAGTVEFIHDREAHESYFLEMNTRLQVEHPVTELITGIDVVAWQIRIAAGERLALSQSDVRASGCALEARIAAEDPAHGYRPQTGTIGAYRMPAGAGVRVDSGVRSGSVIGHHYDSLLAKIISHGPDRETARARLLRGLDEVEIGGVRTNAAFLRDVLALPAFAAGGHTTALLDEAYPAGWRAPEPTRRQLGEAVAGALLHAHERGPDASPWRALGAWRVTRPAGHEGWSYYEVRSGEDAAWSARARRRDGGLQVELNGDLVLEADSVRLARGELVYEDDGRMHRARLDISTGAVIHHGAGRALRVLAPEAALLHCPGSGPGAENLITAPMPGRISQIRVAVGDAVSAGQSVIVLEAMKMLQELSAPLGGTVVAIHHGAGETVDGHAVLVEIEVGEDHAGEDHAGPGVR